MIIVLRVGYRKQAMPRSASAGVDLMIQNGWLCSLRVETSIIIEGMRKIRVGPRTSMIMIECCHDH